MASSVALPITGRSTAAGLDLHILVPVAHRLWDQREGDDRDERVEVQVGRFAHCVGEPIFGVDAGPEVDAGGCKEHDHNGQQHRRRTNQRFTHPHSVAHRLVSVCIVTALVCLVTARRTRQHAIV